MEKWLAIPFKSLIEEEEFTDCCICVESRIFRCHKVILGVASDFFKRSFLSGFKESSTGELVLTNVKAETFEKFRLYAYTYSNETLDTYSNKDIIALMECAIMWMVEPLKKACSEIIKNRLPQMNFCDLLVCFEFAHHVTEKNLIRNTSTPIRHQCDRYKDYPPEVFQLGPDVFRECLVIMTPLGEIVRYSLVEKYVAIHNPCCDDNNEEGSDVYANSNPIKVDKLNYSSSLSPTDQDPGSKHINSKYIKSLLNLINYKKMTPKEFYDGPGKSKEMSFEEKFNLLYSIANVNQMQPIL